MAVPMAASKLLNLRNPKALENLLRQHLLHPSAATSLTFREAQPLDLFHPENVSNDSPDNSSAAKNPNFHVSNFLLNLQLPLGFSMMQIEAARKYAPKDDGKFEEEDDDFGDFDDGDDEGEIENYSGSDFDDDDNFCSEDQDDDEDENPDAARPPSRRK